MDAADEIEAPKTIPWFSDWQERLYGRLRGRLGHRWALIIIVLNAVAVPSLWSNWNKIEQWSWTKDAINYVTQPQIPRAAPGEYTVLLATLDGDVDGTHETYVMKSLSELSAVRVYRLARRIKVSNSGKIKDVIQQGTPQAQAYLNQTGAQIILWGEVVPGTRKDEKVPRLYWAVSEGLQPTNSFGRYPSNNSNELPSLFWEHLSEVLQLLVVSEAAKFDAVRGNYTADKLEPFVVKVRQLLDEEAGRSGQWKLEAVAATRSQLAGALTVLGQQRGDNNALREAVTHYRAVLQMYARKGAQQEWAKAQHNLGNALQTLGELEGSTVRLEEAMAAYREALREYTREAAPLNWALTRNNLGTALQAIGKREKNAERLEEAVAVHQDVLNVLIHERETLYLAMAQSNLGDALQRLGNRVGNTALLEEAVAAYREALKELSRERVPLYWADTQNSLGSALHVLGERESSTARLAEAVAAYREALKENTRERVPLEWAKIQNNLGLALLYRNGRETSTAQLEEAITGFRESLKVFTRERTPQYWASAQHNLGNGLQALGERNGSTILLEEAIVAYREAVKENTRELVPLDWALTQNNLGLTLFKLSERENSIARLEEAVAALALASQAAASGTNPLLLQSVSENLHNVRAVLYHKTKDRVSPPAHPGR